MRYPKVVKKWHVPSRSEEGVLREVDLFSDGRIHCNCPAMEGKCWHVALIKKQIIKEYAELLGSK